eukprot:scaffold53768_cov87-Phaeocystis_antarctica.AAC.1
MSIPLPLGLNRVLNRLLRWQAQVVTGIVALAAIAPVPVVNPTEPSGRIALGPRVESHWVLGSNRTGPSGRIPIGPRVESHWVNRRFQRRFNRRFKV